MWSLGQMRTLVLASLYIFAMFTAVGLAQTEPGQPVSDEERRILYLWEDRFWVSDAEPAGLVRHRSIVSSIREGAVPMDLGEFAVSGHQLAPGKGIVLIKQVFTRDPHPESHVILEGGEEVSHSYFWKLLVYLPKGIPEDGTMVEFEPENKNGAFAMLTRGTLTNIDWTCFGYSNKGSVTAVNTEKFTGTVGVISLDENIPPKKIKAEDLSDLGGYNILLDIQAEFQMHNSSSDSPIDCNQFAPLREGVLNRIWFERRSFGNLPWGGKLMGPFHALTR